MKNSKYTSKKPGLYNKFRDSQRMKIYIKKTRLMKINVKHVHGAIVVVEVYNVQKILNMESFVKHMVKKLKTAKEIKQH